MWEEKKTNNNKIELSLSAIMFFSPLIQNLLKKNKNIPQTDKNFIKWFIKIWYLNILLLLLTITLQIIFYMTKIWTTQLISTILLIVLATSLVIGSIYAISNKAIIKTTNNTQNTDTSQNNFTNLLNYIPLYNIYLRYKNHNFDNPDITLKESLLLWSLAAVMFISFQNTTINWVIVSIIWIRAITLANDLNFWTPIKQRINKLFKKNPEELRWYISWTIITIFNKKTITENITTQKNNYELLFKSNNKQIIFEYTILDIIAVYGLYLWYINNKTTLIFAILFIISRYIIMIVKRNHLPHIPVIREITSIFFKTKNK